MCNKWIKLSREKMSEYGIKPHTCRFCNFYKIPFFLHLPENEIGDYVCNICLKDIIYISICKRCKEY